MVVIPWRFESSLGHQITMEIPLPVKVHVGDLPLDVSFGASVAVDTESMGLDPVRDRLCLVQLSNAQGEAHIVQLKRGGEEPVNLKRLLANNNVLKIFHFARKDLEMIRKQLGVMCAPIYCTKIASLLARTYTDRHNLRSVCDDLLGVELPKQKTSSYWGTDTLSPDQIKYAAHDVIHLHGLKKKLDEMLEREGRTQFLDACLKFLPIRVELDIAGWRDIDIFAHHQIIGIPTSRD